ncbi:Uma2 family endonuclease [Trichothermofontia sp.]
MVQAPPKTISLGTFLELPETQPASEYIAGKVVQKPLPKARHSRLQSKLLEAINAIAAERKIAYAFLELRCTFAGYSIVPDIAVLRWEQIEFNAMGEPVDDVRRAPDWQIEILSPQQSPNRVMGDLLHSLKQGCQLGWLIDPDDRSILVLQPNRQPTLCYDLDSLPVLNSIELNLTVAEIFNWLIMQT